MPFKTEERQYRNFAASNFTIVNRDDEEAKEPSYVVRGHYTTFNEPYELSPGYFEEIDPHALDECDMTDVIFQVDHNDTPLARLRNKSLRLGIDEHGGWAEADLSGSQRGREIFEAISNGLIDRMSFGFTIADDGFEWDEDDEGVIHSRITKIGRLYDVSCVTWPANGATDISARAYLDGAIEAKRLQQELLQRAEVAEREAVARRRRAAAALELMNLQ